jgi:hypothetical protein
MASPRMRLRSSPVLPAAVLLAGLVLAAPGTPPVDLDVALPPGSPLDWGRSFPGYTPRRKPLLGVTGAGEKEADSAERTRGVLSSGRAAELEVRFANSFGMLRILTWDLSSHLGWITAPAPGPQTGPRVAPRLPDSNEPLYWVALAPLLRLHLHPEVQSHAEALAHLVEIGTPVHAVLRAAAGERALEDEVATLRALVPAGGGLAVPGEAGTPRERMLARFVLEELLNDTPYDPTGEFGKRLFLFAEDALPWLVQYAEHPSVELARAAVSALGRYARPAAAQVLAQVGARARDPVTAVRALAALGPVRAKVEVTPLIRRLERTDEPVLRAALIGALGRLGARAAVPVLLDLGDRALARTDSDLLITVLTALARIWPANDQHEGIAALAERVRVQSRRDRKRWESGASVFAEAPDRPDLPSTRAQILEQLAAVVMTQVAPAAEETVERLLELAVSGPADMRLVGNGPVQSDPHASLFPPVRLLYLDALGRIGDPGLVRLERVARGTALDPAERGRAIANLPFGQRGELARALFADVAETPAMRVDALELLLAEHHGGGATLCRQVLESLATQEPGAPDVARRYMAVRALRELGDGGALSAELVLPLMPHVRRSPAALALDRAKARTRLLELVKASERRGMARRLDDEITALLDQIVSAGLRVEPERDERKLLENGLEKELGEVPAHGDDPEWREQFVERWMRLLCGPPINATDPGNVLVASLGGAMVFQPSIPLEEEIVLALGRARRPRPRRCSPCCATRRTPTAPGCAWRPG